MYGQYDTVPHEETKINHPLNQYEVDEDESFDSHPPEADVPVNASGRYFNQQPLYDKLVKAEVRMPQNGSLKSGKVVGRTIADDGKGAKINNMEIRTNLPKLQEGGCYSCYERMMWNN